MANIKVNADLFRLAYAFVSKEETRYYLQGVLVEPHPCGGVNLVSTDGHRMIVIYDKDGRADSSQIVKLSKEALRACKPKKATGRAWAELRHLEATTGTATVTATPANGDGAAMGPAAIVATSPDPFIDGTFPDYQRVIPTIETAGESGCFNPQYIAAFADIAGELDSKFRIFGADPGSPHLVRFSGCAFAFGVLMPIRGETLDELPAFYNAKPFAVPQMALGHFGAVNVWGEDSERYSFTISAKLSPLHEATSKDYAFPSESAARRAYNRVLSTIQGRGQLKEQAPIYPESKISADKLEERKRRCEAIDNATVAYTVASDIDLGQPWRRANLPVPAVASDWRFTVMNLRYLSEAQAIANAYQSINAPVAPSPVAKTRGRRSWRRAA